MGRSKSSFKIEFTLIVKKSNLVVTWSVLNKGSVTGPKSFVSSFPTDEK